MSSRFPRRMVLGLLLLGSATGATAFVVHRMATVGPQPDGAILVPNGQALTPAGAHIEVNDRPLGMVLHPSGNLLAVVTGSNFNPRALHLIDVKARALKQTLPIANNFVGVAFSPAGDRIFVGGGASNDVKLFAASANGSFVADGTIPIAGSAPSGLTLSADGMNPKLAGLKGLEPRCVLPKPMDPFELIAVLQKYSPSLRS